MSGKRLFQKTLMGERDTPKHIAGVRARLVHILK